MSRYLRVGVGAAAYLLDAGQVLEIRDRGDEQRSERRAGGVPVADCRELFEERGDAPGYSILFGNGSGAVVELIVDRVEGLIEIAESELRPLPPIGTLGGLIDAVCVRTADGPPLLRLRGERTPGFAAGS